MVRTPRNRTGREVRGVTFASWSGYDPPVSEKGPSSADYADRFAAANDAFTDLVEGLDEEQWQSPGKNFPERLNDEDESRTVGVIAHHVAISEQLIWGRIKDLLGGRPPAPLDITVMNAEHAARKGAVTKAEVLTLLEKSGADITAGLRGLSPEQLQVASATPAGSFTVAQRVERVLLGHIEGHHAVIEATIARR